MTKNDCGGPKDRPKDHRCTFITLKGKRCKNNLARDCNKYCELHKNILRNRKANKIAAHCFVRGDNNPFVTGKSHIDAEIIRGIMNEDDLCEFPTGRYFCRSNKKIPRKKMPQLTGELFSRSSNIRRFLDSLLKKGIEIFDGKVEVCLLKATQNQLEGKKVRLKLKTLEKAQGNLDLVKPNARINKKYFDFLQDMVKPIIISNDKYILDGHHRWAAILAWDFLDGKDIPIMIHVKMINLKMSSLYPLAIKSPFSEFSASF